MSYLPLDECRDPSPCEHPNGHLEEGHGCIECRKFKGIVYQHLTGESANLPKPSVPRSLESMAGEEELQRWNDPKYQSWLEAELERGAIARKKAADEKAAIAKAKEHAKYSGKSRSRRIIAASRANTKSSEDNEEPILHVWVKAASLEELLKFLDRNFHPMEYLTTLSLAQVREYILGRKWTTTLNAMRTIVPKREKVAKSEDSTKPRAPTKKRQIEDNTAAGIAKKVKLSSQNDANDMILRPFNPDILEMKSLLEFYENKKYTVPMLRKECQRRGMKPVPNRREELVKALAEHDYMEDEPL